MKDSYQVVFLHKNVSICVSNVSHGMTKTNVDDLDFLTPDQQARCLFLTSICESESFPSFTSVIFGGNSGFGTKFGGQLTILLIFGSACFLANQSSIVQNPELIRHCSGCGRDSKDSEGSASILVSSRIPS